MKSLLPNCRFLSLASDVQGRDWVEKSALIDSQLDELGMDLAEEAVYLLFDRAPGAVISGEARTLVARSVIGPKKDLTGPLRLQDWFQAPVYRTRLKTTHWGELLDECYGEWENLQRQGKKLASPFMVVAKRSLETPGGELKLTLEVLFHE